MLNEIQCRIIKVYSCMYRSKYLDMFWSIYNKMNVNIDGNSYQRSFYCVKFIAVNDKCITKNNIFTSVVYEYIYNQSQSKSKNVISHWFLENFLLS